MTHLKIELFMRDLLVDIFKKHKIWIEIVQSFGCNKFTAEDLVMEMYIKLKKNIDKGLDIDYGDKDFNYYYVYKALKSLFLDLKRKEAKVQIISLDHTKLTRTILDVEYENKYDTIINELNKIHWYDRKVFEIIDSGTSISSLSRQSKIPYHSLYNTYRNVIKRLKKIV